MKTTIKGLLVCLGLTHSSVYADVLGDEDDIYLGFQVSTSIDSISRNRMAGQHQFSYLLLQQKQGIKDGLVLTQDHEGAQTLSYLRPSENFDIGRSTVMDYALPIVRLEAGEPDSGADGSRDTGNTSNVASRAVILIGVVGLAALVSKQLESDLEDDWETEE